MKPITSHWFGHIYFKKRLHQLLWDNFIQKLWVRQPSFFSFCVFICKVFVFISHWWQQIASDSWRWPKIIYCCWYSMNVWFWLWCNLKNSTAYVETHPTAYIHRKIPYQFTKFLLVSILFTIWGERNQSNMKSRGLCPLLHF